jgi:hypothetical protein
VDEVAVPLDAALEAKRDQQADGDGKEVNQEIQPAINGFVGSVYVKPEVSSWDLLCLQWVHSTHLAVAAGSGVHPE